MLVEREWNERWNKGFPYHIVDLLGGRFWGGQFFVLPSLVLLLLVLDSQSFVPESTDSMNSYCLIPVLKRCRKRSFVVVVVVVGVLLVLSSLFLFVVVAVVVVVVVVVVSKRKKRPHFQWRRRILLFWEGLVVVVVVVVVVSKQLLFELSQQRFVELTMEDNGSGVVVFVVACISTKPPLFPSIC